MQKYYRVNLKEQKKRLLDSEIAKPMISEIFSLADESLTKTYEPLKLSEYNLFFETGDRQTFDKKYSPRRTDCLALAAALWLSDDDKYLAPLIDLIYHICDEFTWCIAAHTVWQDADKTYEWYLEEVDLFNARTATLLCDLCTIVGDKLPLLVKQRIAYELRRRIIEPTKKKVFDWEFVGDNWIAYCVLGMSLSVALFGTQEEMQELLPRFKNLCLDYLNGFGPDCCCAEGGTYWSVFREFLRIAVILEDASDGEIKFLEDKRVEEISKFLTRIMLSPDKIVSFSDANADIFFYPGAISFINTLFPGKIHCPDLRLGSSFKDSMGIGIIELLWFDTDYKTTQLKPLTTFFKNTQWYINRSEKFSFAAKGGHNDELHNHNDVGSFMVVTPDGKIPFRDLGTGLYTGQYFAADTRYTILNNGSFGHSVPIVNGKYQCFGKNFSATSTKAGDDFFETEISGAYEKGIVEKIIRRFDICDDGISMKDTFVFSDETENFTERLSVSDNPVILKGEITLDGAKIIYNPDKYKAYVFEEVYKNSNGLDTLATFIDFTPLKEDEREFEIKVEF